MSAQGETNPSFEVPGKKHSKRSGLDEEVQKNPTVVTLDSPERASDALPALEDATQDASKEACASLKDGIPARGLPSADKVVAEAPSVETTVGHPLPAKRSDLIIGGSTSQGVLISWC